MPASQIKSNSLEINLNVPTYNKSDNLYEIVNLKK